MLFAVLFPVRHLDDGRRAWNARVTCLRRVYKQNEQDQITHHYAFGCDMYDVAGPWSRAVTNELEP